MVNCSAKIVYNPQRVRQDGSVLLYMRVIVDRKKKDIDLKLYWPVDRFDKKSGRCRPRSKEDELYKDQNLTLADEEAKANEIFIQYRLRRVPLSLEVFLKEYHSGINKELFLEYMFSKIHQRYRSGEIEESSRDNHLSTYRKLKLWKPLLSFSELNHKTAQTFDTWMLRKTGAKSLNARWAHHKNFKTYLNQANEIDHIELENPYIYFKAKKEMGRHQPLMQDELLQLWEYYQDPLIHPTHRVVCRAFLFTCVTGMRHGDLRKFTLDWINGEFYDFVPHKTRRYGTRVRLPITEESLGLLADEIDEIGDKKMFQYPSEQKQNDYLKEIRDILEIQTEVCFQVGRETFATLFMEHDGSLSLLADFMGHTTTRQSEKYVKIRDLRRKAEAMRISKFLHRD